MKPQASNIQIISPTETGVCDICEGRYLFKNTETVRMEIQLTVRDTVTPLKAGACCSWALLFTDHMLTLHGPRNGIIHPPSILPPSGNHRS